MTPQTTALIMQSCLKCAQAVACTEHGSNPAKGQILLPAPAPVISRPITQSTLSKGHLRGQPGPQDPNRINESQRFNQATGRRSGMLIRASYRQRRVYHVHQVAPGNWLARPPLKYPAAALLLNR